MARWIKVNALLRSVGDQEKQESLGLDNLEVEVLVKPIVIDLDRVESYAPSLDKEGEEVDDEVDIIMYSGLSITLKSPFREFDKTIRK
jgi:hypothetical protein